MLRISDNLSDSNEAPFINIRLVPNRSLDSYGTKVVFSVIACGFLLPIIPFIGSQATVMSHLSHIPLFSSHC